MNAANVVSCLTPPGRAALATLSAHGPGAWAALRTHFRLRSGKELTDEAPAGRFWLGRLGEAGDEVVVVLKQREPIPWVEVHGHGGREVVRMALDLFRREGFAVVPWAEFLRAADSDPLRARAAEALAHAPTARTAGYLLAQYHGAFSRALAAIRDLLLKEDRPGAEKWLSDLAARALLGQHLVKPWRVAVVGAPNVGKSSLINALAGYPRSIVSATPGTTRDVVTTRLAVDGWPVELADTAGQRAGGEDLEQQGIDRARAASAGADLVLWVLDGSAAPVWPDEVAGARLVLNKVDLPAAWEWERAPDALRVSAKTGEGIAELCAGLSRWLVPAPPPAEAALPFTEDLAVGVEEVLGLVRAGDARESVEMLGEVAVGARGAKPQAAGTA